MAADGRFGFIRGNGDIPPIAGVLTKLGLGRWTVDDVAAEAELRLREAGSKAMYTAAQVKAPARYVLWLLERAVPDEPPAQIAAALAERVQADAAWAEVLEQDRVAARLASSGARQEARAVAERARERARQARSAPAPRRRP